jgi:hypothetical protein
LEEHIVSSFNVEEQAKQEGEVRLAYVRSRDSSVGIATGYRLDDGRVGVRVSVASRIFASSRRPDRFWGLPRLLSNGY